MFEHVKQINELRKKAKDIESQLASEVLEITHKGVVITVSANQDVLTLDSHGASDDVILSAVNESLKESKKAMAKRMRGQIGDLGLNIPGM